MIRYGKKDCQHEWVARKDGYEEYCFPVICKKCGAFGYGCDLRESGQEINDDFYKNALSQDANINGQWENPYVKIKG